MKLSTLTTRFLGNRDTAAVFRGMATLALGSGLARVIGIASIPILTRLYTPEDFGVMAVFTALIALMAPLLTLRYILAVPLPRHDGLAMNLMVLSAGLMLVTGTLLAIGLAFFAEPMLALMSMEVLAPWWWLIVLGLIGSGTYEMLSLWATRRRAYKVIAYTNVTQSAAGALVKVSFGFFGAWPIGLLIGQVVAKSGGIGTLLRHFWAEFRANWRHVRRSRLERVAVRHRGFPIYRLPSQVLLVFSAQAPVLFIATLYDAETTGQFGLAMAAIGLPLGLLGQTTAKAFYAEAANIGRRRGEEIRQLTIAVLKRLAFFAAVPTIILLVFGPELFRIVFGGNWELAGVFASILAIYLFFQFIQTPVAHLFYIFERQRSLLVLNVQRVILVLMLFAAAGYLDWSPVLAITAYAVLLSLHYMVTVFWALGIIKKNE
ncbi:lipopolysaccharide biosynthesis protein [Ectothiorhodospira lacustris]|uniref:lipopolysaccharide biosynthesis protein n=1 Tax=Ectothiorhodospira lacustris TaxID=2899127 RepID=UPI001EE98A0F|nr:oligosaccharide flippase family protein [Ectothiorhodospira lacustris]MCG5501293.1 oligosaccharide flippase family protein [Ectothiorhodospira lacustris]